MSSRTRVPASRMPRRMRRRLVSSSVCMPARSSSFGTCQTLPSKCADWPPVIQTGASGAAGLRGAEHIDYGHSDAGGVHDQAATAGELWIAREFHDAGDDDGVWACLTACARDGGRSIRRGRGWGVDGDGLLRAAGLHALDYRDGGVVAALAEVDADGVGGHRREGEADSGLDAAPSEPAPLAPSALGRPAEPRHSPLGDEAIS